MKLSSKMERCGLSPMRKFNPYADKVKERGIKIYHLNIGQPDVETPAPFFDALRGYADKVVSYAPSGPRIDEPSAGYIFAWDPFGNGSWIMTDQFEGEGGTHAEYIEGLTATDMKKTSDDLACYCASCV